MNTFNELTYPQQLLFALIKLALWNTAPDTTLLDRADDAVWNEVYRLSADQGIHAIVFDGVILLPIELQPSRTIKIAWAANVAAIERRYAQKVEVANDIVNHFTEKGISMLLFKGIGLAQYYPVPQHREFGDIDFYLFDRHEEGNRLLVGLGAVKHKYNIDKHVIFFYKGVPLENHAHFLAGEKFRNVDVLEKRLQKTLEDHSTLGRHAGSLVLFPPPDFNALFMICHAFGHFMSEPLVLRYCLSSPPETCSMMRIM